MKLAASAVKQAAQLLNLTFAQPESLKTAEAQHLLRAVAADVMVVAAYGLILPQAVLDIPRHGCLNIHASLLPRWRGAAPIQRAILAGDTETGITIMQMDAGLDTGAMLLKKTVSIVPTDSAGSLHDRLAVMGASAIVETLTRLASLSPEPQQNTLASYAAKISKEEARLDWRQDAATLLRQIRAYNPFPGAFTTLHGETLKVWHADTAAQLSGPAGEILQVDASGVVVGCDQGAIRLVEVQAAGSKRMPVEAFIAGRSLQVGERLGVL